jgi:hypothetical protein
MDKVSRSLVVLAFSLVAATRAASSGGRFSSTRFREHK